VFAAGRIHNNPLSGQEARRECLIRWPDLPWWNVYNMMRRHSRCSWFLTHMRSAFCIVESRCAMAIVVRPFAALSRASCTTFSEFESSADVASSSRRTLGFRISARAIAIRSTSSLQCQKSKSCYQIADTHAFALLTVGNPCHLLRYQTPCFMSVDSKLSWFWGLTLEAIGWSLVYWHHGRKPRSLLV